MLGRPDGGLDVDISVPEEGPTHDVRETLHNKQLLSKREIIVKRVRQLEIHDRMFGQAAFNTASNTKELSVVFPHG